MGLLYCLAGLSWFGGLGPSVTTELALEPTSLLDGERLGVTDGEDMEDLMEVVFKKEELCDRLVSCWRKWPE